MKKVELKTWKKVEIQDLPQVVQEFQSLVKENSLITLTGPLGAGKTTFVSHFLNEEGGGSPTYSVVNEYKDVLHCDLYRIEEAKDMTALEIDVYLDDKSYAFFEWGSDYIGTIHRLAKEGYSYFDLSFEICPTESQRNLTLSQWKI